MIPPLPVQAGASAEVATMEQFALTVNELLDNNSDLRARLSEEMEAQYPIDGKNADRVAAVLISEIGKKSQ